MSSQNRNGMWPLAALGFVCWISSIVHLHSVFFPFLLLSNKPSKLQLLRNLERHAFNEDKIWNIIISSALIFLAEIMMLLTLCYPLFHVFFLFLTATIYFVLCSSPHNHVLGVFRVKWVSVKGVSEHRGIGRGERGWKCPLHMNAFSLLCSHTETRDVVQTSELRSHADGWAEAERRQGME